MEAEARFDRAHFYHERTGNRIDMYFDACRDLDLQPCKGCIYRLAERVQRWDEEIRSAYPECDKEDELRYCAYEFAIRNTHIMLDKLRAGENIHDCNHEPRKAVGIRIAEWKAQQAPDKILSDA
jgi:hypothetical protein